MEKKRKRMEKKIGNGKESALEVHGILDVVSEV